MMFRKFVFNYRPILIQCQKRKIFMSGTTAGRSQKRLNPYSSIFKDDMLNLTPDEVQEEITFMSNMPLQGIMNRQNLAKMDIKSLRKRSKFKNIERKYFKKDPEPCFLTCSMKEQIRNLHMMDSSLWTPVNLSYVFPATQYEIKSLIKDKPPNLSEDKLKLHDKNVLENWKRYAKGQFGNISLLKKTIEMRFSEVNKTKLPAATMGGNQEVNNFLDSLKFTDEDDEIAFHDEKSKKHLNKLFKSSYPFKETFKEIITNYDNELVKLKALEGEEKESTEITECKNLSEILPKYEKEHSDSYVKVTANGTEIYQNVCNSLLSKNVDECEPSSESITYEDFCKLKEDPKLKSRTISNLLKKGELKRALILTKEVLANNVSISTGTINLLLQHLCESGDYSNIEFIGNQLSVETRTKTKLLNQLVFAYQKMGETNIFLNRVLKHFLGHCNETLVNFIPSPVMHEILLKEPHLEALIRECACVAATGGFKRMMAGLLNAYLILIKFNEAEEIYIKYFANETFFNISTVCHQAYLSNNRDALNSILELVNRHPAGREKMKAFIYSTLLNLLCEENKFEEAKKIIEKFSSHNLELKHIRKDVLEKLICHLKPTEMSV